MKRIIKKTFSKYKVFLFMTFGVVIYYYKLIINPFHIIYPAGDIYGIFFFEKKLIFDTIQTIHSLPLWNPFVFSGTPFVGNPSPALFYPINLIFLIFPIGVAFGYVFMFDTLLLGTFTYIFVRSIKVSPLGSFISSLIMMFSGFIPTRLFAGHLIAVDSFIYFPLLLYFLEIGIQKRNILYGILASFPITLSFLAGHTQITIFLLFASFLYFVIRIFFSLLETKERNLLLKAFAIFPLAIICSLLLSSVQLIPNIEFSQLSTRSDGISFEWASSFSMHPFQVISFVLPHFFGTPLNLSWWGKANFWEACGYAGVITLFLVLGALLLKKNKYTYIFIILSIFSLVYAFGSYTPLFSIFYNLPIFSNFRVPARFLPVYIFSLAVLAGMGANALFETKKKINNYFFKTYYSLLIFIVVSTSFIIVHLEKFLTFFENSSFQKHIVHTSIEVLKPLLLQDLLVLLFSAISFLLLLFSAQKRFLRQQLIQIVLCLIVFFDLFLFSLPFINTQKSEIIFHKLSAIEKIKTESAKEKYRVFDKDGLLFNYFNHEKIEQITGIHSLYLSSYRDFLWKVGKHENTPYESFFQIYSIDKIDVLRLLNTKYVTSRQPIESKYLFEVTRIPLQNIYGYNSDYHPNETHYYIYELKTYLPRAYFIHPQNFSSKLKINQSIPKYNQNSKVSIVHVDPHTIKLHVSTSLPQYLILSEVNYPGWKAYVDKAEVPIITAFDVFRSIYVSSGQHDIIFSYYPNSYHYGRLISGISFFVLVCILIYNYLKFKKSHEDNKKIHRN